MSQKRIGLVVKPDPKAEKKAKELAIWLADKGISVVRKEGHPCGSRVPRETGKTSAPADLFCLFALGGDGTFLSAVRWIGDQSIPILGVKFGEVGFLAETVAQNRDISL